MRPDKALASEERSRKLGLWLMALGLLCLAASLALYLAARRITRKAGPPPAPSALSGPPESLRGRASGGQPAPAENVRVP
ncbi:MAG: hypothetical protein HY922_07650 [Elusimicrobia bacterium]|nr:hypothetical protein [Elusimicrobiota bacterium]